MKSLYIGVGLAVLFLDIDGVDGSRLSGNLWKIYPTIFLSKFSARAAAVNLHTLFRNKCKLIIQPPRCKK
jgi:hypothetical protein